MRENIKKKIEILIFGRVEIVDMAILKFWIFDEIWIFANRILEFWIFRQHIDFCEWNFLILGHFWI